MHFFNIKKETFNIFDDPAIIAPFLMSNMVNIHGAGGQGRVHHTSNGLVNISWYFIRLISQPKSKKHTMFYLHGAGVLVQLEQVSAQHLHSCSHYI